MDIAAAKPGLFENLGLSVSGQQMNTFYNFYGRLGKMMRDQSALTSSNLPKFIAEMVQEQRNSGGMQGSGGGGGDKSAMNKVARQSPGSTRQSLFGA